MLVPGSGRWWDSEYFFSGHLRLFFRAYNKLPFDGFFVFLSFDFLDLEQSRLCMGMIDERPHWTRSIRQTPLISSQSERQRRWWHLEKKNFTGDESRISRFGSGFCLHFHLTYIRWWMELGQRWNWKSSLAIYRLLMTLCPSPFRFNWSSFIARVGSAHAKPTAD